ncbi:MAG: Na/Pi cotransporter family protein [Candidatus Omnitrophica bacterium]|nr:Na/Pi cotransporter family protein [Candidatus Omnitrophota bacterium]
MIMKELIFNLIGGLGFFFLGMQFMSKGLKKIAGEKIKNILHMATKISVVGVLVGAGVTCLIQSSSATTVMVVGFVNAGLLVLKQAISVIMGANIGTTFTAWLVSSMGIFKITNYALPAIGVGFGMMHLGRTRNVRFWGQVLMGFGMLFIGLSFLKDAFEPLKQSAHIKTVFVTFSNNPLLGVLIGIIFTVLLQSSSATIAIVQVLAFNGLITFPAAIPIILGDNIGTTITAQLAAIGTNLNARRAAMAHTLFNVIGVTYMLFFVYTGWFIKGVNFIIPGQLTTQNVMFYIAVAHSVFNVFNTIVFLPFVGFLEKISIWMVPKRKDSVEMGAQYLEKHLLDTPPIAMQQARMESVRMLDLACESVSSAVKAFLGNYKSPLRTVSNLEQIVDGLQSEITQYLVELSEREIPQEESEELPVLIHSVNDIERIGDHSENIVELFERKKDEKLSFSNEANEELNDLWRELREMMSDTKDALKNRDIDKAEQVLAHEITINNLQKELKNRHVNRLNEGICNLKAGLVFIDLVDNFEKIGDHLTNIAQGVAGKMKIQKG